MTQIDLNHDNETPSENVVENFKTPLKITGQLTFTVRGPDGQIKNVETLEVKTE